LNVSFDGWLAVVLAALDGVAAGVARGRGAGIFGLKASPPFFLNMELMAGDVIQSRSPASGQSNNGADQLPSQWLNTGKF
jgi:hypothetical protein